MHSSNNNINSKHTSTSTISNSNNNKFLLAALNLYMKAASTIETSCLMEWFPDYAQLLLHEIETTLEYILTG